MLTCSRIVTSFFFFTFVQNTPEKRRRIKRKNVLWFAYIILFWYDLRVTHNITVVCQENKSPLHSQIHHSGGNILWCRTRGSTLSKNRLSCSPNKTDTCTFSPLLLDLFRSFVRSSFFSFLYSFYFYFLYFFCLGMVRRWIVPKTHWVFKS